MGRAKDIPDEKKEQPIKDDKQVVEEDNSECDSHSEEEKHSYKY